jgi:hypothetical protein
MGESGKWAEDRPVETTITKIACDPLKASTAEPNTAANCYSAESIKMTSDRSASVAGSVHSFGRN